MNKLLLLMLIFFSMAGIAQNANECGNDAVMNSFFSDPANLQRHLQIENKIYNADGGAGHGGSRSTYLLPVVFHIIHNGGPENISDALVLKALDQLNNAFRNSSMYDSTDGVNTNIQFCLAKQNPQGQATTGIDRVQSPLTNLDLSVNDVAMKNLTRWNPTKYINIWIVKKICSGSQCNIGGYAYFPSAHGSSYDGIVVLASTVGSSPGATSTTVHEMGHYLGLYHSFQGGCTNNNCLTDGDKVCDTPPDNSTAYIACSGSMNSCTTDALSGFTTDQPDMHKNYMDYTPGTCRTIYTAGQRDRMHWHINNVRSSLLNCNSCLNPCTSNITASFSSSDDTVTVGTAVTFTNASTSANSYKWFINGALASTQANPSYTFNTQGTFIVRLEARGTDTNCLAIFTDTIIVNCGVVAQFGASVVNSAVGQAVTFTNLSTGATTYQWLVDGVVVGTAQDLTYTFNQNGAYSVYLIATSAICSDTTTILNFIQVGTPCQASFTASNTTATSCLDVEFKPDTVCDFSNYLWTFCEPQFNKASIQTKNFVHPVGLSIPAGVDFLRSPGGKYYGFYGLYDNTTSPYFYRLDFGTSVNNTPVRVPINTPTIPQEQYAHGLDMIFDNGKYYGFVLFNTNVYRLEFGTNIENTNPVVTKLTGFTGMNWGHRIEIVHETNNWWLIIAARTSSAIHIMFLGNSITNNVQSTVKHTVNACAGFSYHKINGKHVIWATSLFDGIKRFNFGNSLANTPTASAFMKVGAGYHDDIALYQNCDGSLDGVVMKENITTHALIHIDSVNATLTLVDTFSKNMGRTAGMSRLIRTDAGLTALTTQGYANAIGWLNFKDCGLPFSTQKYPAPVSYTNPGTYYVRMAVDEGLPTQQVYCDNIVVTNITAKPLNLGPDTTMCVAGVLTLNAGSGYKRYLWHDLSQDSLFSASGAGTYSVEVEDHCGNIYRDTITITVDSMRTLNLGSDTVICTGAGVEIKLNNNFSGFTYNPGNITIVSCTGCPNPVVFPSGTTTYTVTARTPDGCITAASITVTVSGCTGIEEAETIDLTMYPNPAKETVSIRVKGNNKNLNLEMYNAIGQQVLSKHEANVTEDYTTTLDVSGLAPGVYFIKVNNGVANRTLRLLVD